MSQRPGSVILAELVAGAIDPRSFDHRDHVAAAIEALSRFEFFQATQIVGDGLRAVATKAGAPTKFNATLTFAFMSVMAERLARAPQHDADSFLLFNPDLTDRTLLHRWYSAERVSSNLARQVALMPDRAPDG